MDLSIPYYEDMTRISNSNLGIFIKKGPRCLKDTLDGTAEGLKASYLDKGTMIHMYILQPDEFWAHYRILDFDTPSSKQQQLFAENLVGTVEIDPDLALIKAYSAAYSTKGKSNDKVLLEAKEMAKKLENYIEYLKTERQTEMKVISFADLQMLKTIKSNLEKHKKANELLYNLPNTCEQNNEFHINWEFPKTFQNYQLSCKSLLDRLIIDHTEKKIILVDLKTTADVNNFKHSIEEYDYRRQLAYYWLAIHWYFKYELQKDIAEYTYETYIIAIQSNNSYEVKVFKFTPESIEAKLTLISDTIEQICWHKQNNLWDYSRNYYEGDGSEIYNECCDSSIL